MILPTAPSSTTVAPIVTPSPAEKETCFQRWAHAGTVASGFGGLLAGAAALGAVWQAKDLLREITKIQDQAANIQNAIDLLGQRLKKLDSANAVGQATEAGGVQTADPEKIEKIIDRFPETPFTTGGMATTSIYLPPDAKKKVIEQWKRERDPEGRRRILENQLMIGQ